MVTETYTAQAVAAVTEAVRGEHDFGGWLSLVLVLAAAQTGSLDDLTSGRPGSWEAALVDQLARGLAGDDDGLAHFRAAITTTKREQAVARGKEVSAATKYSTAPPAGQKPPGS
jgi:hypothetical protein